MVRQLNKQPSLAIDAHPHQPGFAGITVRGLDAEQLLSFGGDMQQGGLLRSLLRVSVVQTGLPADDNLPGIFGRYQVVEGGLRFIPHFPFEPGLSYQACFNPRRLGHPELSEVLTLRFSIPRAASGLPTEVQHVYPSSDSLPENLLRFYVSFSNSMQRGRADVEIAILGPDREPASDVLYRAPVELWDKRMKCLTILLDPGRLKRGVGPNRALGPPLKSGAEYTLSVGAGMLDLFGRRLGEAFYKRFRVTEPVREKIAVEQWKVVPPASRSREPLRLLFPRPLDWALLAHTITIASADGQSIEGRIDIDQHERRWNFTPAWPWVRGPYQVRVAAGLEDVCGNSVISPFDRPLRQGSDSRYEVVSGSIPFNLA